LAAQLLLARDPEAVMGVFPSDHLIARAARYRNLVRSALRAAAQGRMVVLGIQPRWAETGYGYMEFPPGTRPGAEPVRVLRFREKPEAAAARRYVAAGRFFWNAGMFFWRADVLLQELRKHLPRCATMLAALPAESERRFAAKLREVFPRCENISIDYAVLERAENVWGIACQDIGWNDVGSWNAVYELSRRDGAGNVAPPGALLHDSRGNFVDAGSKTVALLGVEDLVVVDTPDALLIADRRRSQQVGEIVKLLEKQKREELL
jgi:mannose-1-phosphate guanylyltransferase